MASLYLHIPFCLAKCGYCDFASFAGKEELFRPYMDSLCDELQIIAETDKPPPLTTLFVGGGTPTVLPSALLGKMLETCCRLFGLVNDAEVSVEANPGSVDRDYLLTLKQVGVTRVSFGCQSFVAEELARLGRIHGPDEAESAVAEARRVGYSSISLDLMYGIPGQHPASLEYSLERALGLGIDHLSIYQLGVETDTPFGRLDAQGLLQLPDEETVTVMDEMIRSRCFDAGFHQYEISNFAKLGHESRHNCNYWQNEPYWAAGAGAVSYRNGTRARRAANPERYIANLKKRIVPIEEEETLSLEESFRETVVMGLRMVAGISRRQLLDRFGIDLFLYYRQVFEELQRDGLVQLIDDTLRLTGKGRCFANQVMAQLV